MVINILVSIITATIVSIVWQRIYLDSLAKYLDKIFEMQEEIVKNTTRLEINKFILKQEDKQ